MSNGIHPAEFVTDTVAFVTYVGQRRMGERAFEAYDAMVRGEATIYVPGMVFAELMYLAKRRNFPISFEQVQLFFAENERCVEAPLSFSTVRVADEITDIPDLHDRLIAATARERGLSLLTDDGEITKSAFVNTIW